MRCAPYLPAVVLLCWALFTALAGDALVPFWLAVLGVSVAVMVRALLRRYSNGDWTG